ncbi:MAG: hypothetical protein Q8L41_06880 [Anaerolineales bacterium]|nr:hypothetical protein [Anaerolineales bacterium]
MHLRTCNCNIISKAISCPLLDRIDIHIEFPRVDYEKLIGNKVGELSETIRKRVQTARNIQNTRFANPGSRISNNGSSTDIVCNADMRARLCTAQCHRILKLARTIVDLAGSEEIQSVHLAEALQYRPKLMM